MAKILIADDSGFMRKMITRILTQQGHEIIGEAKNGIEAVKLYKELKPDLVTMDITMPLLSGLDALRNILHFDKEARVIMCSALGQQSMILDSIKYGAKDFLVKPFEPERLHEVINNVLQD